MTSVLPAPSAATVVLDGEIDCATSPAIRQYLMAAISAGSVSLTVDMAAVRFIDVGGINVLLAAAARARRAGGGLSLRAPSPHVQRLIGVLSLGAQLPVAVNRTPGRP